MIPQEIQIPANMDVNDYSSPEYWNNKFPKSEIFYSGRPYPRSTTKIPIDVRLYVTSRDCAIDKIIADYRLIGKTDNETAQNIQRWVYDNIQYAPDLSQFGLDEFWALPFETLFTQKDDCEGGACLIASMLRIAGIPAHRVKVCAGWVQAGKTAPRGGHAYCIYLADRPDSSRGYEWVILDWCYSADPWVPCSEKPLAKNGGQNGCYGEIWWTFNDEYAWAQNEIEIHSRVKNV